MKYYTDGFTKLRNPSPIGGGYSIFDENNTMIVVENIDKVGMTNNEAELLGMHRTICIAQDGDTISTDSMNTIAWLRTKKKNKIARQDLLWIIEACREHLEHKNINIIWEGRDYNLAGIYNEKKGIDTGIPKIVKRYNYISHAPKNFKVKKKNKKFSSNKPTLENIPKSYVEEIKSQNKHFFEL